MQILRVQNSNYNTNFGAKLDVKNLNHWRWNKIAEKFEQATKEYPNDILTIQTPSYYKFNPHPNGEFDGEFRIFSNINNGGNNFTNSGYLSNVGTKILTTLEDEEIVDKFVFLHKIYRTASDIHVEGNKLVNKFIAKFKDSKMGLVNSMFYDAINKAEKTSIRTGLCTDDVWGRLS